VRTSAPVFREVAQEVLEYLGVPHDQTRRPPSRWRSHKMKLRVAERKYGD